jgi:hypothetical protein
MGVNSTFSEQVSDGGKIGSAARKADKFLLMVVRGNSHSEAQGQDGGSELLQHDEYLPRKRRQ